MQNAGNGTSSPREKKIALLLCLLAAIHVFVFSAAFPFFNNVDEGMHFDLVLKYSHGQVPRYIEPVSADSAGYLALMNSHAYLGTPAEFPGGQLPPPAWTLPPDQKQPYLQARSDDWQTQYNYEISQAPLYYVIASFWWHIGRWVGLHDGRLVYWLRFLNVILVAALVWVSYCTARIVFPENLFLRLGVPAIIALIPQTTFYSVADDVLSPLFLGITFVCLLKWFSEENPSVALGVATGLAFAATYLSKVTNAAVLGVVIVAALIRTWQIRRHGDRLTAIPTLMTFLYCSELPIIGWVTWCKLNFGDLTGLAVNIRFFGWTVKPLSQRWDHPIFTPGGFGTYLSGQFGTFWQGEFWWHHQRLALPGSDALYTLLSLACFILVLPRLFAQSSNFTPLQRAAFGLGFAFFAAGLGFFAYMSTVYDFHGCPYPSRQHPYFTSGRQLLGALIPFALMVMCALDRILASLSIKRKFLALAVLLSAMLLSEIATDWPVFSNEFNWFHLP